MADYSYFLAVAGNPGSTIDTRHGGAIDILDYAVEVTQSATAVPNGGTPSATFGNLSVTVGSVSGLAKLMSLLSRGQSATNVTLSAQKNGGTPLDYYKLDLGNVFVTSVDAVGSTYVVSLAYKTFELELANQKPDGSLGSPSTFGWDVTTQSQTTVPSVGTTTSVTSATPVRYFLLVDGMDGGSIDNAHARWFEVSSFDIDLEALTTYSGSGGEANVGVPRFAPLKVSFDQDTAITDFLLKTANGAHIAGVRLEGVTGGPTPTAVYDLTLSDVVIQKVDDSSGTGFSAELDYKKIELVTKGQNPQSGAYTKTGDFGFDRSTRTFYTPGTTLPPLTAGSTPGDGTPGGTLSYALYLTGIGGPSVRAFAPKSLEVQGYAFDVEQSGTAASDTGPPGATSGLSTFGAVSMYFADATALAPLLEKIAKGQNIMAGTLTAWQPAGASTQAQKIYDLHLGTLYVTGIHHYDAGYEVDFVYKQIGLETFGQSSTTGQWVSSGTFGWDVSTGMSATSPTAAAQDTATPATAPARYFLCIQGFDGGSTDPGHQGWFDVSSYSLDVTAVANILAGGGASVGTAEFGLLTVNFGSDTALTKMLANAAAGTHAAALRLEGVSGGENPTRVYDLSLSDVIVQSVSDQTGSGYSATFDYRKIELVERGQKPDGTIVDTARFGFDRMANKTYTPDVTLAPISPGATNGDAVPDADSMFYFMQIAGVPGPVDPMTGQPTTINFSGDATNIFHKGALSVASVGFDVSHNARASDPQGAGAAVFSPVVVHIASETGLANLTSYMATGVRLGAVSLYARTIGNGAAAFDAYALTLSGVTIENIAANDGGYDITLDYQKIGLTTRAEKSDGTSALSGTFGWDVQAGVKTTVAEAGKSTAIGGSSADRFFLYVEGVDGGSTEKNHIGWFDVSSHSMDALQPLDVTVGTDAGLVDLLRAAATGDHLRAARLEGVSTSTSSGGVDTLTPVYDVSLADLVVRDVVDTAGPGYSFSLDYAGLEMLTRGRTGTVYLPTGRLGYNGLTGAIYTPTGSTQAALSESEVGNGSSDQSGTLANQTGGRAVKFTAGPAVILPGSDESITYTAPLGDLFTIKDIPSGRVYSASVGSILLGGTAIDAITTTDTRGAYINGGQGNDNLRGGSGSDILYGGDGNDVLNGLGGVDIMDGGNGSDTYYGDATDIIQDTGTSGTDLLYVTVSTTIGATSGIENLTALATLVDGTLTGNGFANRVAGNATNNMLLGMGGDDTLYGYDGSDTLNGGAGRDTLIGGAGADTFTFVGNESPSAISPLGFDTISDFVSGTDMIDIDVVAGPLSAAQYAETSVASSAYVTIFNAAKSLMADGAHPVVFVAGTKDGYLFWNNDNNATTPEGAVRLSGLNNVGLFANTDVL